MRHACALKPFSGMEALSFSLPGLRHFSLLRTAGSSDLAGRGRFVFKPQFLIKSAQYMENQPEQPMGDKNTGCSHYILTNGYSEPLTTITVHATNFRTSAQKHFFPAITHCPKQCGNLLGLEVPKLSIARPSICKKFNTRSILLLVIQFLEFRHFNPSKTLRLEQCGNLLGQEVSKLPTHRKISARSILSLVIQFLELRHLSPSKTLRIEPCGNLLGQEVSKLPGNKVFMSILKVRNMQRLRYSTMNQASAIRKLLALDMMAAMGNMRHWITNGLQRPQTSSSFSFLFCQPCLGVYESPKLAAGHSYCPKTFKEFEHEYRYFYGYGRTKSHT